MKKICYIVTIPLTIRAFFIPQLQCLAENGYDVSVICCSDENLQSELGDKIRFIPVDMPRGLSVLKSIKAVRNLVRVFKNEKFDMVQYSTPNAALYAGLAAKRTEIKIRNYHLMGLRYLGAGKFGQIVLKAMEKFTCRLSTSVECVSNSNLELGVSQGLFPREKATVVWNGSTGGVDISRFDFTKREKWKNEIRHKYGIADDDFVFGFVGRITKDKGINELLEAFFNLKSNAKLMIIGVKEGVDTLDAQLWQKAIDDKNVIIVDAQMDIERYYSALDILVFPSYREGFGNVIIEAGALGTPSIVSNIPGPIDAIENGKTGITVNKADSKDLLDKMILIQNENILESPQYCSDYVKEHFDSNKLCEYILERKNGLV